MKNQLTAEILNLQYGLKETTFAYSDTLHLKNYTASKALYNKTLNIMNELNTKLLELRKLMHDEAITQKMIT